MAILRSIFDFHLRTAFQRLGYIFRPIYRVFLLYDVTSRDVRKNIADPREDCGSFVDESCGRYIVGTLTNKANISI